MEAPLDPKELRKLYNHTVWSSPRAKIVAKMLGNKTKRITHEQALRFLAAKCETSLAEFLKLPCEEAWRKLGFVRKYSSSEGIPYDPLSVTRWAEYTHSY